MDYPEFKKLLMDLPRQPLTRQRPWLIAGFVLVFIILLIAAYGYFSEKKHSQSSEQQKKISSVVHIGRFYY